MRAVQREADEALGSDVGAVLDITHTKVDVLQGRPGWCDLLDGLVAHFENAVHGQMQMLYSAKREERENYRANEDGKSFVTV